MQLNDKGTGQREDVRFVNKLLHAMDSWHHKHPKSDKRSLDVVKKLQNFAQFLYEHLGIQTLRAGQEAKAFATSDKDGNAISLKHFSLYQNNPETDYTMACPGPEIQIRLVEIRKKFYKLCSRPNRDGTTLEGKLADIIACYAEETAMLQREPNFDKELGTLTRDQTILIIAQIKGGRDRAREQLKQNPESAEAQQAFKVASEALKAMKQTSRGLFATVSPEERRLELFLECVYRGDLGKVEDMLNNTPELALGSRKLTDLSGREFPPITGLQYAAWARDMQMEALIKRYLPDARIKEQLAALHDPNGPVAQAYGTHWSFDEVLARLDEYASAYKALSDARNWDKLREMWCKGVGGAQRKFPAWLILTMCEAGKDVAWVKVAKGNKEGVNQEVKRDMKHLEWWFEQQFEDGHLGEAWAAGRGVAGCAVLHLRPPAVLYSFTSPFNYALSVLDHRCLAEFRLSHACESQNTSQLSL